MLSVAFLSTLCMLSILHAPLSVVWFAQPLYIIIGYMQSERSVSLNVLDFGECPVLKLLYRQCLFQVVLY